MAEKKFINFISKDNLLYVWQKIKTLLGGKVDKVEGKGLSTNDLTDELKQKILNAGDSSFDGQYTSLVGKPSINGVELKSGANTLNELGIQAKIEGKNLSSNDYTTADKNKLAGIEANAQVNIIESISINGTEQTVTDKGVNIIVPEGAEYSISEVAVESGYSKSYSLTKDGTAVGAKINIPKDLVIQGGSIKVVATANTPYDGAKVGDKYLDILLNDAAADHIYIPVDELVDAYMAGNGININQNNEVSIKISTSSDNNGLILSASGLGLKLASATENGAMSSAMVLKLNGIDSHAQANAIESISVNDVALTPDSNKNVNITMPSKISDLENDSKFIKETELVALTNEEIDEIFTF